MAETFKNKTVVITGGATGIGFGFGKAFGEDGARTIIAERRENRLKEAASALEALSIEAHYFICDVTQPEQVEALADFAFEAGEGVDVLLNNAGVAAPRLAPVADTPLDEMQSVMNVNFFGVWHGCASFMRRMVARGQPAMIYNTGSENSFFNAVPNNAAYLASKHAVLGLTDALREEAPDFIHVGMIAPGWVKSELMDERMGRMAMDTDEFVARAMPQIRAREAYVVTHAYNAVRIANRQAEIEQAFERYAPRYEGDEEYDVRTVIAQLSQRRS